MKKVKLTANILFSGIGCQERGFRDSGLFDIEVLNTSDINKESVVSYAAIHCGMTNEMVENYAGYPTRNEMAQYLTDINLGYQPDKKKGNKEFDWFKLVKKNNYDLEKYWLACKLTHNLGDISRINKLPYADFWTISFPCTDISISGKMAGLEPNSGTRSSLLWENIRLLNKAKYNSTLPKYIMVENVKNLVSKKFIKHFKELLNIFDSLGFNSYWSVINGKDCGIPQNRERVFVIAIRKDIDVGKCTFPKPFDTGIRLKDVLEDEVDEKYYLRNVTKFKFANKKPISNIIGSAQTKTGKSYQKDAIYNQNGIINSLLSTDYKQPKQIIDTAILKQIGQIYGTEKEPNPQAGRIYDTKCLSPALDTCNGGNRMPKILQIKEINSSQDAVMILSDGTAPTHTVGQNNIFKIIEIPETSYCLDANYYKGTTIEQYLEKKRRQLIFENTYDEPFIRIRKLTPRECWRLMGLTFEDCDKASELGVANTHLYRQAGNGIITNCCALLAEHLYKAQYDDTYICTDERYWENFISPQVE